MPEAVHPETASAATGLPEVLELAPAAPNPFATRTALHYGLPASSPVRIAVYVGADRPGLLSEITGAISSRNGNITKAEVTVTDDRKGINHFVVEVEDLKQLQAIMQAIRDIKDVINVERVRGL